jgi:hypothetical protein
MHPPSSHYLRAAISLSNCTSFCGVCSMRLSMQFIDAMLSKHPLDKMIFGKMFCQIVLNLDKPWFSSYSVIFI